MVYIKFWLKFVRQRMISMDDQYIVTCLTVQNLMLSSLLSILMVRIGKWLEFGTLPLVSDRGGASSLDQGVHLQFKGCTLAKFV